MKYRLKCQTRVKYCFWRYVEQVRYVVVSDVAECRSGIQRPMTEISLSCDHLDGCDVTHKGQH